MEMENHRLRMAVIELEAQQERLKCTISIMREEMEKQMNQVWGMLLGLQCRLVLRRTRQITACYAKRSLKQFLYHPYR